MSKAHHPAEISLDRLDARLAQTGLSDFKASKLAGGPDLIRDLRRGKSRTLTGTKLARLAEALDCDPEYLTREQDAPRITRAAPADQIAAAISISSDEVAVLGLYRAASDAERIQIKAVMRAIIATGENGHAGEVDQRGRKRAS